MKRTITQWVGRIVTVVFCVVLAVVAGTSSRASIWEGGAANWSSDANPGWNGTGSPNAIGAVADFDPTPPAGGTITTIATGSPVTVGSINYGNNSDIGNNPWTITNTGGLTLNQDGAGSGFVTITNSNAATAAGLNTVIVSAGTVTLADDVHITNTTTDSQFASGAIAITSVIAGTGNLTLNSSQAIDPGLAFNSVKGSIRLSTTTSSSFAGNVTIERGLVTYVVGTGLGAGTNNVFLGATGNTSDVALVRTAGTGVGTAAATVAYPITVASGQTGTITLGSLNGNAGSVTTFNSSVTANSNLRLLSGGTATGRVDMTGPISGAGGITKDGIGVAQLINAANTYQGNTTVSAGTLVASGGNGVPDGPGVGNVSVASGATLVAGADETINGLSGAGIVTVGTGSSRTLTVGSNNATSAFSGTMQNNGARLLSLIKTGTGTLTHSGSSTYTGTTTVNDGKLLINGSHTGTGSAYTVNTLGTLGGTGSITGIINLAGGTLAPGDPGGSTVNTLTVGGLTLNDTSHTAFELNPTDTTVGSLVNDYLDIAGVLTAAGPLTINIDIQAIGGGNLSTAIDRTWTLASYDTLAVTGTPTFNITGTVGSTSLAIVPDDAMGNPTGPGTVQLTVLAGLPGDYNNNGSVDAADYVLWRKGGPLQNEVDAPGTVNDNDYTEWRARFGNTAPGSGAGFISGSNSPVPEPATCLLLGLSALILCARRNRLFSVE